MSLGPGGDSSPGAGGERAASGLRRSLPRVPNDQPALPDGHVVAKRYRISGVVGRGGMGAVYRAEQLAVKREVALKVMAAQGSATAARFEREALAASRMKSPHVVTIHDFGQDEDGLLFLVMELLQGESLGSRMHREGAIPWREAVSIAMQIARALSVAHAAGVVHRDLKPDNVFLTVDDTGAGGVVKVLDFGIARLLDPAQQGIPDPALTSADIVVGTPLYMSPEACARREVGPGADVYALGVMLFEMLTGRTLWDEQEPVLIMGMHIKDRPRRLREARPGLEVPAALEELVLRMLAKSPAERPADGAAALSALRSTVDSTAPIQAPKLAALVGASDATLFDGATDDVPRSAPSLPAEARWPLVAGGVALAIAAAAGVAIALVLGGSGEEGEMAATELPVVPSALPPPPSEPAPAEPPVADTVEVRFELTPDDAVVREGEEILASRNLWLPRDGATHVYSVSAAGHATEEIELVADVDRVVTVVLPRETARARGRRGATKSRPVRRAPMMREW